MEILITSIITFISTNIDDIFILTLFFGNSKFKKKEITAGQFMGIGLLIVITLMASCVGLIIDQSYIGLLGFFPIYLGIRGVWNLFNKKENENSPEIKHDNKSNIMAVASVTFANGGDNLGIYIPLFATISWINKAVMILIFILMTGLWCLIASYLIKHPRLARLINKYGHIVTPFVLIMLGLFILKENDTINLFTKTR